MLFRREFRTYDKFGNSILSDPKDIGWMRKKSLNGQPLEVLELWSWLTERKKQFVSEVEIYKSGPSSLRNVARVKLVLEILHQHGYVRPTKQEVAYEGSLRRVCWEVRATIDK